METKGKTALTIAHKTRPQNHKILATHKTLISNPNPNPKKTLSTSDLDSLQQLRPVIPTIAQSGIAEELPEIAVGLEAVKISGSLCASEN
jgi:hypothetical protein